MQAMELILNFIFSNERSKNMNRKTFLNKIMRLLMLFFLSGLVFVLGKKLVFQRDCNACSEYGNCSNIDNCKF